MENSKRFLDAFVAIEMFLKDQLPSQHTSFTQMVYQVGKTNKLVAHFANDLNEFAQLRNAITHRRTDSNEVIAEPHLDVVSEIEGVLASLTEEKPLLKLFKQTVFKADLDDDLAVVLMEKRKQHYSVVPVYRKGVYVGMVHDGLFARCFEAGMGSVSIKNLSELLAFQDAKDRVVFLRHDAVLIDALAVFNEYQNKGTRLIAIVLTTEARVNHEPLLILTLADLPKIMSNLNN